MPGDVPIGWEQGRGDEARGRLLDAALRLFGTHGFDAVSIRQIAEAAEVNVAAISYYFGGKKSLYLATAEHLADTIKSATAQFLEQVRKDLADADPEHARDLLRQVMRRLTYALIAGPATEFTVGFVYGEQIRPTEAFEILYERSFRDLFETISMIVGRIRDLDHTDPEAILVAHAVHGQILTFRASRATILRRLNKASFSAADVEQIADLVASLAVAALAYQPVDRAGAPRPETPRS